MNNGWHTESRTWRWLGRHALGLSFGMAAGMWAHDLRAEAGVPWDVNGPPPFSCAPALLLADVLPRNAPGLVIRRSTLSDSPSYEIVGDSNILATASADPQEDGFVIVKPMTVPAAGNYRLRYREECQRGDGGWERRAEMVELPFQLLEASPLPTTSGTLSDIQKLSPVPREMPVTNASGQCEIRAFDTVLLNVVWQPSADMGPFLAVTQASGLNPAGFRIYFRRYMSPLVGPYSIGETHYSCYEPETGTGVFATGSATFSVVAQIAGAAELPRVSHKVTLGCPASRYVRPCDGISDGGVDVVVQPDTGSTPPDVRDWVPDARDVTTGGAGGTSNTGGSGGAVSTGGSGGAVSTGGSGGTGGAVNPGGSGGSTTTDGGTITGGVGGGGGSQNPAGAAGESGAGGSGGTTSADAGIGDPSMGADRGCDCAIGNAPQTRSRGVALFLAMSLMTVLARRRRSKPR